MINNIFIFFLAAGIFFGIVWFLYRRYRNFDSKIADELTKYHLIFKYSKAPPLFLKSPFSNFEIYDYHPSTSILGINGEEVFRRIVIFEDKNGKEYKSWVEIQTRAFIIHKIKWELELENWS